MSAQLATDTPSTTSATHVEIAATVTPAGGISVPVTAYLTLTRTRTGWLVDAVRSWTWPPAMNPRHLAAAVAATALLALVGLVILAGGGAVATGLSAGHTPPSSCPPAPPTGSGTTGPSPAATPARSEPSGPRAAFAAAYLTRLGAPTSPANLAFLTAWMTAESGPDTGSPTLSAARYNTLNTTEPAPGSWPFNSAGVQNYPTAHVGITTSADTTQLPPYAGLLAALRAGTDAKVNAQALDATPWGTGTLVPQILAAGGPTACMQ